MMEIYRLAYGERLQWHDVLRRDANCDGAFRDKIDTSLVYFTR